MVNAEGSLAMRPASSPPLFLSLRAIVTVYLQLRCVIQVTNIPVYLVKFHDRGERPPQRDLRLKSSSRRICRV